MNEGTLPNHQTMGGHFTDKSDVELQHLITRLDNKSNVI